jgi:NADPH:quinone reductase-like Zn-dependent oxidoreductase
MKAMVQDHYGSAEVLETREVDKPEIGDHEVLVRVHAAGVNPADWAVMSGLPYIARPVYGLRRPKIGVRGTDVAGQVEAVGSGVTKFRPGDSVFGWCNGSFADFAAASEDALALKPANLTFEQAASVPMAGLVALQAVRDHGKVQAGQKVLINGASGGIGTFAVQIAKSLGAEVTGVCSTPNVDMVRSIGADHVIDYTREDFTRSGLHYDFTLDNVSNHSLTDLRRALTPTGVLIPNGGNFGNHWFASAGRLLRATVLFRFGSQRLGRFLVAPKSEDLVVLKELVEAGKVTPVIDHAYPLSETAQAMDRVGGGHSRGKVVITVSRAMVGVFASENPIEEPVALPAVA